MFNEEQLEDATLNIFEELGYDSSLTLSEGIYWKEISGNVNGNTFTYTADNPNVHEKGLIKINGVKIIIFH